MTADQAPTYCFPQCRDPWFQECADCWKRCSDPPDCDSCGVDEDEDEYHRYLRDSRGRFVGVTNA